MAPHNLVAGSSIDSFFIMIKVFVDNEASIDRTVLVDLLFDDLRIGQDLNGGQAASV